MKSDISNCHAILSPITLDRKITGTYNFSGRMVTESALLAVIRNVQGTCGGLRLH